MTPMALLWAWLALANLLAFAAMGQDKLRARRATRRTPELALCLVAALGGAPGAWLGMRVFRHKTRKPSFQIKLALATLAGLAWLALVWRAR